MCQKSCKMKRHLHGIVLIAVCIVQVTCYYENQPKIISSDGHLIIESAVDRNVTISIKGNGFLNVGDLNLLKMLQSLSNVSSSSSMGPASGDSAPIEGSAAQLQYLMNAVKGPFGLLKRVSVLENGTADSNDGIRARGRINNISRRLTALERKVTNLVAKLRENNCKTSPCQNGGTCISGFNSFVCQCTKNWEGPTCATDVNECSEFAGTDLGCQNGATCKNTPGSYSCLCANGWQGIHCNSPTKDCMANGNELCGHGTCVQIKEDPGYKCICDQGWKTNGVTPACSVDVDECNESKPHCSKDPEVTCINLPGSFVCGGCPPGYSGNGFYCVDIDECQTNNGGCSTSPSVTCINTRGSYKCGSCPLGYIGDGKTCTMRGNRCTPGLCHPLARCKAFSEVVSCQCPPGYQGSGFGPTGCIRATLSPCDLNPCKNGGTCTPVGTNNYTCSCPAGTALPNCARLISPCVPNPCLNGGTCTPFLERYVCSCPAGYTGLRCQGASRACGGILDSYSGTLRYPVDNGTYNHNARCAWLIKTNYTKVLNVTFTHFDLESSSSSSDCKFDWLQIHDGKTSAAFNIGRFCGNKLPKGGNLMSTHNFLYLWFRSDNSSAHGGFELHWDSIDPVCGGDIAVKSHGIIASPGSPGKYPPNRDCKWFLRAPPGKRLQFHFFTMKLEAHDNCQYDYVKITDGIQSSDEATTTSPVLAMFCNTSHPEPLVTPGNEATVSFHSDEDNNDAGFQISYSAIEGVPGCGGVFTTSEGEISSPRRYEDNLYPHNLNCEYLIQLPKGSQITVQFSRFHLESSDSCKFDYLEMFDGRTVDDPTQGKFCGDRIPPTFSTTSNNLLIKFRSDWSTSHGGFLLTYKTRCGGIFTEPGVEITSPGYPNNYEALKQCDYLIQAPPGQAILLDFSDFSVEGHSYPACEMDFVAIYDSFDPSNSTLVGRYCSSKTPPRTISTMNVLFVRFVSDISVSDKGFKANFSFVDVACGGVITSDDTTIRSPAVSERGGYIPDADCRWVIVAPKTHAIQLTWNSFDLEKSTNCAYDFVEIYDNSTSNHSFVGRYCGITKPPAITSGGNVVTIRFKSDSSQTKDGFSLSFTFVDVQRLCGGHYYTAFGLLKSPGSPEYTPNKICEWVITVPPGQQILLNVRKFVMEKHSACRFDGLEIRNGGTASSPLIGKYCGTDDFNGLISFSNKLYLKFYSDSSRNYEGFEIEWDGTATGCGGVLTSARGSIISPHYPEPYGNNALCSWRISVSAGSAIHIVFTDLELESHGLCRYDYLEIFDGRDAAGTSMGKYCTSETDPIQLDTTSNHAFLRMKSDDTNQGRGFHLKYQILCHRNITGYSGVIESPNFPDKYPVKADCLWTITVPPGNKIDFEFSHFDVENGMLFDKNNSHVCNFDYVEIIEQIGDQPVSSKYCNHMPTKMTSKGPTLQIGFRTDGSGENGGFRLEWQINGCGGILTKPAGAFSSPNYPREYPPDTQCVWTISMPPGSAIDLTVTDFNMESSSNCRFDGLTISNTEDFSQVVTQLCHSQKDPVRLVSAGHTLYVKFFSDHTYTYKGFAANYKVVPQKCGGPLTVHQGFLYSPNYPKNYPSNQSCEWIISTDPSHTLQFNIEDIGMIKSPNCTNDYLMVYDGPNRNAANLLMTVCDSESNVTSVISSGSQMLVAFQSDATLEAKGFRANFSINCGARINVTDSGMITLENTAKIKSENCTWVLTASKLTKHVTLQVLHMNIVEVDGNCLANLTVHDGDTIDAPIRYSGCGSKTPPVIVSNGNSLVVHITSEDFNMYNLMGVQLVASYSILDNACGGELHSFAGQIASPNYPNSYPMNVECVWHLKAAPGNRIRMYIESINIFEFENCNEDYVEIRESSGTGKLIGDYCGDQPVTNVTSANSLWIKFKSSDKGVAKGFLAEYSYDHFNELTGRSGAIASPTYPHFYARDEVHSWRIIVDIGSVISIKFIDVDIDSKFMDSCEGQLEIYDGFDDTAEPLIAELCGTSIPESVTSTSNVVYLRLDHSDANGPSKFLLNWVQVGADAVTAATVDDEQFCGGHEVIVLGENSTIYNLTSPGYPDGYRANLNCSWIFQSSISTLHPMLKLGYVDLEETDACVSDYLAISTSTDMISWSSPEKICTFGYRYKSAFHGKPFLKVSFNTDYFNNRTGFTGFVSLQCGGVVTEPNGVIEVASGANFNQTMARFLDPVCMWNITVRPGRIIQFQFDAIKIGKTGDGCVGSVSIKNGIDDYSPLLGAYCGNEIPQMVNTSSNRAFVKFFTGHVLSNSFRLSYREIGMDCGGKILLRKNNSTIITTPRFPEVPFPHSECIWTIMAPSGETLVYKFEQFNLKYSALCQKEYVELRDGGTSNADVLVSTCGSEVVQSKLTTSNMLRVKYFTDFSDPGNGFKLRVSLSPCGGSFHAARGTITSKNYPVPGGYPSKTVCEYFIHGSMNTILNVTFQDLHLPGGANCSTLDNVKIYSIVPGENNTDINQGTFCGTQLPPPIITENNLMKVVFTSFNAQTMYRGFKLVFSSSDNRCGSEINAASGDITSPGYPVDGLRLKRFCEWRITVPEGRRIKVEFTDLDLSTLSASYLQRIGFYHGFDYASRIKFVMGGYDKQPIYSSGNTMMVNFWSRIPSGNRGFKLHFSSEEPTICVGNLEGDQGIVATPINQTSYTCEYKRNTAVNGTLAMYFTDMNAGTYRSACTMNTRGIFIRRSGSFGHNAFLKKYCGNATATDVIRSPFSDVSILARQGLFLGEVKFKLQYQVHKCGGMFGVELKNISSPNIASNVVNPLDCAWYVNYPENSIISIQFTTFALNQSCDEEYMMIYNGPNTMSPLLGRYCKDTAFEALTTQGSHLFVEYHSERYNSSGNFQLMLAQMSSGCGGTLHKNSYAFASALSNGKYLPNTECIWTMQADNGYHIGMYFVSRYSLEKSENCSKDHIEVLDRVDSEWVSLGRVCGKDTPKPFNSTGSMLRVIFRTDGDVESDGFTVQWEQNCGGVYEVDAVGAIMTSPNYPLNYERMKTCNYTFVTKEKDSFIRINFLDFALENGPQTSICMYDNVTIYKQQEYFDPWQWEKVGTFCKEDSPGRLKYKNRIAVVFQTDRWLESRGFKFEYKLDVCGGAITESTQIESPEMTGSTTAYGYNTVTCAWNITIPTGKKVVIRFEELDIEHSDGCYFDSVEVFKGLDRSPDKKLATLCGNITAHAPMISIKQSTHGVVYYKSEPFSSGRHRFSAQILYFDDCDREITLDTKSRQYDLSVIGSDNKKIQDCQYSFRAPEGFGIRFTFNQFHVGSERNVTDCSDNFVEIRDGAGPFGELIGRYCGQSLPQPEVTFSAALFARLVTDSALKGTGFSATVSLVESPCGAGYYNLSSGEVEYLKSPNYGSGNYTPNSKCMWMLEVPAGKSITVEFQDLQLQDYDEKSETCPDRIEVFDANLKSFIYEGLGEDLVFRGKSTHAQKSSFYHGIRNPNAHHIYCGNNELPATYHSAASKIYVKFQSDEAIQAKGFKLAVRQNQFCAQNFTRLQGRVSSNYFTRSEHCTLTIQAPENYTISLYFGMFYTHTTDCTAEGIRFYDGLGKDKQVALLCNYVTPNPIFTESNALTIDIPASSAEYATTMLDATYLATDKGRGCGGEIFNYGGVFTSPLYPNNNRTRMECLWTVTVPVNMHIAFKFDVFDMGSKTTCGTDFVKLMKVQGEVITEERRHCGGDTPAVFICESNAMQVMFKQTQNFGGTGWQAKFMAIEKGAQVNEY